MLEKAAFENIIRSAAAQIAATTIQILNRLSQAFC